MSTIGTFTKSENGYTGTVRTLNVNVKVKFVPNDKTSDKGPDYRVLAGNYELGAAWAKTSQADRPYLSVSPDDPSFPAALYARLVERKSVVEGTSVSVRVDLGRCRICEKKKKEN